MTDMCKKIQQLGKGIASPSRYRILEELMGGKKTVTEIVDNVRLSQPAVSQHLATLKSCGLVVSEKHGQEVHYSLDARYVLTLLRTLSIGVEKCRRNTFIVKKERNR